MEDPVEYDFANTYLLGWQHWTRLCENKIIRAHIDLWREELELKLRSRAVKDMIRTAPESFQAAKWLADRGWSQRGAGRPTKAELEHNKKLSERIDQEYTGDVLRLFPKQG